MALDVATLPLILYRKVYYIARTSYTFLPCFITLPFLLHFFISNVFSTCIYYGRFQLLFFLFGEVFELPRGYCLINTGAHVAFEFL